MNIPFDEIGDASRPPLTFLHANGYPPGCYASLFNLFGPHYHIRAMRQRPLWQGNEPDSISDWVPLSEDILRFWDETGANRPQTVIGHSMGGIAALRAALTHPQRFHALILLDPVLFPPYFIVAWNILRALGLGHRLHPLIPAAQARRREFDDLQRLFSGYRRKATFKYMDDAALQAYIHSIACAQPGPGYRLCYSAEWEAHIYYTGVWRDLDLWRGLPGLTVPTLIIRGAETDTFWASTGHRAERSNPLIRVETIPQSTHLVPLERPEEVFQKIQAFLSTCAE